MLEPFLMSSSPCADAPPASILGSGAEKATKKIFETEQRCVQATIVQY
jgi:hypothetical protein